MPILIVFCVSVLILSNTALAQVSEFPRHDGVSLQVYMPEQLDGALFGDPVFMPITIANLTDRAVEGTTKIEGGIDMIFDATSGAASIKCSETGAGYGTPSSRRIGARTLEAFVVNLNIWSPSMSAAIASEKQCKVKLRLGIVEDYFAKESGRSVRDVYSPKELNCIIHFDGTAFEGTFHDILVAEAKVRTLPTVPTLSPPELTAYGATAFSIAPYVSPISWYMESSAFVTQEFSSQKRLSATALANARKVVKQHTKLSRTLDFCEVLELLSHSADKESWDKAIPSIVQLLEQCTVPESQFYIKEFAFVLRAQRLPENDRSAIRTRLANAFPLHAAILNSQNMLSTVSLLSVDVE